MEVLISFLIASVLLTLSPGPDLMMVVGQALENGFKKSILFVLGLISGLAVHTSLLVLGWSQFIGENSQVVSWLKIFGFFYFIFIGIQSLFSSNKVVKTKGISGTNSKKVYLRGILMNLLNPKVSLFFWFFFPGFLFTENLPLSIQYAILGTLFLIQAFLVFVSAAYFATLFLNRLKGKWIPYFNGFLWIGLGVYLLLG